MDDVSTRPLNVKNKTPKALDMGAGDVHWCHGAAKLLKFPF